MTSRTQAMKTIKDELERVQREISALHAEKGILEKLLSKMSGEPAVEIKKAKRAVGLTPLVLDVMRNAGASGLTTNDAAARVAEISPDVAKTSVAAILSRLKSDGALVYVGDRYFEKQYAPSATTSPFDSTLRAVS